MVPNFISVSDSIAFFFFVCKFLIGGNSSKMLNFEGMKCVSEKVLILNIFLRQSFVYGSQRYKDHFVQFTYNRREGRALKKKLCPWTKNFH